MRTISQAVLAAIVIAAFIIYSGCGSIGQKSPTETVKAAIMAANDAEYSEADKYLSADILNVMKGSLGTLSGGMKGAWDEKTHNGTIKEIEILKEEVRGEGATVNFKIHFKDGKTEDGTQHLIKENGQWKFTI